MPTTVPTNDEYQATVGVMQAQIGDLEARLAALEELVTSGTPPPDVEEPPDPEPEPEPPPAGTLRVTVALAGAQLVYNETDGKDIGAYTDPDNRFAESCVRITRTDTPLRLDIRRMPGRISVVFGQGYWSDTYHGNLPTYTATIEGDELPEPVTYTVPSHAAYQRTRWCSAPWPLPMRELEDLYQLKLLPRFDPSITRGHEISYGHVTYTPMGLAGLCAYMPQTGGRGDIGHVTSWSGAYICHPDDPTCLADVLAQGEAAGTFTWDYCDKDTNACIDPLEHYPSATLYNASAGAPYITYSDASTAVGVTYTGPPGSVLSPNGSPPQWSYWWSSNGVQGRVPVDTRIPDSGSVTVPWNEVFYGGKEPAAGPGTIENGPAGTACSIDAGTFTKGSGITLDSAHQPSISYLPFLLTGDPYYLENLQRQAAFIVMENPSAPVRSYGVAQPRAAGWSGRTLAQAAKVSPDDPPSWLLPRRLYTKAINDWAINHFIPRTLDDPSTMRQAMHLVSETLGAGDGPDYSNTFVQHYQEDIALGGIAWLSLLHPDSPWPEVTKWHVKQVCARVSACSGWSCSWPSVYKAKMAPAEGVPCYDDWGAAWEGNAPLLGNPPYSDTIPPPDAGSIDYYTHMSSGMAIAWQAGADNTEALTRLMQAIDRGMATGAVYMDPNRCVAGPK